MNIPVLENYRCVGLRVITFEYEVTH